MRCQSVKWQFR